MDTSGSRPTEAGVSGASSSTDPTGGRPPTGVGGPPPHVTGKAKLPSQLVTQEEALVQQRITGTEFPWCNRPIDWKLEVREDDSQSEEGEEEPAVVDDPWIPSKQAEGQDDWWNYPIDAGVCGHRQYVSRHDVTMGACALYTLTIGKGAKGKTGAAGTFFEAKAIDTTDLENTKGWNMLMKYANLTEEEKQHIKDSAAMPPLCTPA